MSPAICSYFMPQIIKIANRFRKPKNFSIIYFRNTVAPNLLSARDCFHGERPSVDWRGRGFSHCLHPAHAWMGLRLFALLGFCGPGFGNLYQNRYNLKAPYPKRSQYIIADKMLDSDTQLMIFSIFHFNVDF